MDGELIDAILKPFLDRLPGVSDERDIDEPDADEEIVFREPIVGGSASMFSQRKLRSHLMNKIHAVDFRLDGSGVVNILDTDVTRDPAKLELRQESMQQTEEGAVIIRRFDLTDEEKHRQMEREIFEEPKTAEEKLRAGDPAATVQIMSKAKSKAASSSEAASSSSGIAQVIGDTVSQFIKPKMRDQATMIQPKPAPQSSQRFQRRRERLPWRPQSPVRHRLRRVQLDPPSRNHLHSQRKLRTIQCPKLCPLRHRLQR